MERAIAEKATRRLQETEQRLHETRLVLRTPRLYHIYQEKMRRMGEQRTKFEEEGVVSEAASSMNLKHRRKRTIDLGSSTYHPLSNNFPTEITSRTHHYQTLDNEIPFKKRNMSLFTITRPQTSINRQRAIGN